MIITDAKPIKVPVATMEIKEINEYVSSLNSVTVPQELNKIQIPRTNAVGKYLLRKLFFQDSFSMSLTYIKNL